MAMLEKMKGDPRQRNLREIAKASDNRAGIFTQYESAQAVHTRLDVSDAPWLEVAAAADVVREMTRKLRQADAHCAQLAKQQRELDSVALQERQDQALDKAVAAGIAHVASARETNRSAYAFVRAVQSLQAGGFANVAATLPGLVPTCIDLGQIAGPGRSGEAPPHDLLERFAFAIEAIRRRRAAV